MDKALNVVICGYPKSGTTWLTRLIAECLCCPAAGYWNINKTSIVTEGLNRPSKFICYKSHDKYSTLLKDEKIWKVITIVRNPKDIVVSGAYHFNFLGNKIKKGNIGRGLLSRIDKYLIPYYIKKKLMLNSIINGNAKIKGLGYSWNNHVEDSLQNNSFILKYEDLLEKPVDECLKIFEYLNFSIDILTLKKAIDKQSFDRKKEALQVANEKAKLRHIRKGKSNQWMNELNSTMISKIENEFKTTLTQLQYSCENV